MKTHGTIIHKDTTGGSAEGGGNGENTEVDYNSGKENEGRGWEREKKRGRENGKRGITQEGAKERDGIGRAVN